MVVGMDEENLESDVQTQDEDLRLCRQEVEDQKKRFEEQHDELEKVERDVFL